MGTYPTSPRSDFIAWCKAHQPVIETQYASIGLSQAQADKFKNDLSTLRNNDEAQESARQAAKAATTAANASFATMKRTAADTVRLIRVFANNAPDPSVVYATAEIDPPAPPTPLPPPGRPTDMTVELDPTTGAITLRWKSVNPRGAAGTSYIIRRKLPGESTFTFVGVSGVKKFTDRTFVAGPDTVMYTIQAQRSDSSGPVSDILTINFGAAGGGPGAASKPFTTQTGGAGGEPSFMKKAA
jgi:hypothetical protein